MQNKHSQFIIEPTAHFDCSYRAIKKPNDFIDIWLFSKYRKWCVDTLADGWHLGIAQLGHRGDDKLGLDAIYFKKLEDATLFVLTWND